MKAVGVKVLKAKLSEYLRLVKTGQTVLVTEHDEVIAELHPAHRQKTATSFQETLSILADKGEITQRSAEVGEWKGMQNALHLEGLTSKEILDFLRGDSSRG